MAVAALRDVRKAKFQELVRLRGAKALADALGISEGYVSFMKTGRKTIGGDYAREVEKKLGLPAYWLDGELGPKIQEPRQAYHGVFLTRAGALLGAEWEKLDVADRAELETAIYERVARRMRGKRRAPEIRDKDKAD